MGNTFYFEFEITLMEWIQNMIGTIGVQIASLFTMLGEEVILVGILAFLYWCYDKEFAKSIGVGIVIGLVGNAVLKNLVLRRRPYFDSDRIKCLKPVHAESDIYDVAAQGFSFPSGHSTNSAMIFWGLLHRTYKKHEKLIRTILILLPIGIGISRVVLGVHYPTDVIVGWIMGGIIALFFPYIKTKRENRWKLHLIIFLISLTGVFFCKTFDYYTSLGVMAGFFIAIPFEERFVDFKNTREPIRIIFRLVIGMGLYIALNTILKLPFDTAFLATPTTASFLVRTLRYALVTFMVIGVYPMSFDRIKTE